MAAPVQLDDVTKRFGETVALDQVTLTLESGEVFGFLGPNGAGKTTALRIALGLLYPTSGRATILGHLAGSSAARQAVAFVPGEVALWPRLTGEETLLLLSSLHGMTDESYRTELVARFELDPTKRVRAYSKGNRQKVALIAAFSSRAPVLVFDEPTSGLDPLMERVFRDCVEHATARGQTVFLSSHLLNEVDRLCHRVAMIRRGRIVTVSSIDELRAAARVIYEIEGTVTIPSETAGVVEITPTPSGARVAVSGSPAALLTALAGQDVRAMTTRDISLEEIFLSYYDEPATA